MDEQGKLGRDLPNVEEELFELDKFPLFDLQSAIESMSSETMVREILQIMVNQEIPTIVADLEKAYCEKNWAAIENLAHKMKGGAVYAGTIKLKYACQYLERYYKAGHRTMMDRLYHQLIKVNHDTQEALTTWLERRV